MDILHNSTNPTLLTRLQRMIASSRRADIAVGYFFVSGFEAVADEMAHVEKTRLLVGRTDRSTLEEVAVGLQQAEMVRRRGEVDSLVKRSDKPTLAQRAVDVIGEGVGRLQQTDESQAAMCRLRDLVAAGKIEVRTYLRERLHAKAYICWYGPGPEPGAAVVGSSNFTLAGLEGNTELNVRVTGDSNMQLLQEWFDKLWGESEDISSSLVEELDRSWPIACTPPYHVYLKALYELYRDEIGLASVEPPSRHAPPLTPFQLDAVRRALAVLDRHNGVVIGDVVGLGKTFIGAEVLRQLRITDGDPLIICPASLRSMWEKHSELFGISAQVISMSSIIPPPPLPGEEDDEESAEAVSGINLLEDYPNRGPVLIDESHNFRNPRSRRHRAIAAYLASGNHKTVLMSATPQNLGPLDVYYQLRLFLDDINHGLSLEPLHLEEFFRAVQKWYQYRLDVDNWEQEFKLWQAARAESAAKGGTVPPPPLKPSQPVEPAARIEQVLVPVFIRRRRKDIVELYGTDIEVNGKKLQFPDPVLENVPYNLSKVYRKAGKLEELANLLKQHKGARYAAAGYLTPAAELKPQYEDLKRARNRVADLVKALLWKRLESSVPAFGSTIEALIRSNEHFQDALGMGFVPIGSTATRLLAGEDYDATELLDILKKEETRRSGSRRSTLVNPVADFDTGRWLNDLQHDLDTLKSLLDRVSRVSEADDDKLAALRLLLCAPEVQNKKVLVFSESEETVNYLYDALNPGGTDNAIVRVSGSTSDREFERTLKRFAPMANLKKDEAMPGPAIRIVIATDRLSEGQNLQDCNRVLNYDLHWNPVRLIQRFGRVDRITTTHEVIHLNNMWPDTDLDMRLHLTERLHNRIQAFHDLIGLDSKLLSHRERINPRAMYRIYVKRRLPDEEDVLDEVAAAQRGIALLQRIQQEDEYLWQLISRLPDGIRSALPAKRAASGEQEEESAFEAQVDAAGGLQLSFDESPGLGPPTAFTPPAAGETVVFLKQGEVSQAYAVSSELTPRPVTSTQMLAALECGPDEPAEALPSDTNERVMAAFNGFEASSSERLGRARRPRDTRLRRYLSNQFRELRNTYRDDTAELARIGALQDIFLGPLDTYIQMEVDESRHMRLEGIGLLRRLEALRDRHRLTPPSSEDTAPASPEAIRTVCSGAQVSGELAGTIGGDDGVD